MAHANEHLNALLTLSPEERVEAANRLLDSVEEQNEPGWAEAWITEMTKRLRGIQAGSRKTVDAATARARVLERLQTLRQ